MGTLTLSELRDEVRAGLGNRTEFVSDTTRIDRWINQAQTRIARRSRFKELNDTESYTPTFADDPATDKVIAYTDLTNSNPRAIYSMRVIDGSASRKLQYIPHRMWDRFDAYPESRGTARPNRYTIYAHKFELWPIPGQAYEYILRLAKWPTVLTAAGQASDLDEKDDAIVEMSLYLAFMSFARKESADDHIAAYRNIMADAIVEDEDNPDFDSVPPHTGDSSMASDYWADPFARTSP